MAEVVSSNGATENAGVDNVAPSSRGGQRGSRAQGCMSLIFFCWSAALTLPFAPNSISARAPPQTPPGELTALPQTP